MHGRILRKTNKWIEMRRDGEAPTVFVSHGFAEIRKFALSAKH